MLCELVPPLKLAIKERGAPWILLIVTVVTVFTCIVSDETFEWTCSQIKLANLSWVAYGDSRGVF